MRRRAAAANMSKRFIINANIRKTLISVTSAGAAATRAAHAASAGVGAEAYGRSTACAAVKYAHSVPDIVTTAYGYPALDSRLRGSGNHKAAASV